jgi:chromosomal replication initiator protein
MWFKDTYIIKQEDGVVFLGVPNVFVKDWLVNKYHKEILKNLRNFGEHLRNVEYVVSKEENKNQQKETVTSVNELPLNNFYVSKDDNLNPKYTFETFVVGPFNELAHAASQAILKKPLFIIHFLFLEAQDMEKHTSYKQWGIILKKLILVRKFTI